MNSNPYPKAAIRARLLLTGAALAAAAGLVSAQTAPSETNPPGTADQSEQVVRMSQFEVTTTQGQGYVSSNAARAFKTDQALLDVPQADIVLTNDLIRDSGYANTSDVAQYAGLVGVYEGEPVSIRGTRDTQAYIDDMIDSDPYEDNVNIDSYEVIKGPAEVIYPNAALSGIVLKSTKKPLPYEQNIITETVDEWGLSRTTIDSNTPLGALADATLAFRLVGAFQRGDLYIS